MYRDYSTMSVIIDRQLNCPPENENQKLFTKYTVENVIQIAVFLFL